MREKDLIRKIRNGNEKAFRQLYTLHFHKIANYAFRLLRSEEDTREVVQDVFLKIWNKRRELNPETPLTHLLFKITKFTAIDAIRKQQTRPRIVPLGEAHQEYLLSFDNELNSRELQATYTKMLERLPEKRKRIFQMSRDENLSHREIAERLDISVKTVETHIRLALQQFREYLKDQSNTLMLIILFLLE
ncbi:RNA polymerase sigma-70 factor [Fulvivirga sp. M361]|uniref:RNA polymerase sigma factor n=1 Tax=Fulvivirga sp. M361 TaxID=2594266 RepID=UPI00117A6E41|nr:RNA polymerase sigma-70 factor [Fulvivirga sp. M361]TRX49677.1 RNA polymerase sigma-70 factor [Fulvivirga sp. M361]